MITWEFYIEMGYKLQKYDYNLHISKNHTIMTEKHKQKDFSSACEFRLKI